VGHPILDSLTYPWKRPEAKGLFDALARVVTDREEILAIFEDCGGDAMWLRQSATTGGQWRAVIDALAANGLVRPFAEHLRAYPRLRRNARFHRALSAVLDAPPIAELRFVEDGPVVLDRESLRTKLGRLDPDANPLKVLIVRGEPENGKSHGRHLFARVAHDRGAEVLYLADGMVSTVEQAVELILGVLGGSGNLPDRDSTVGDPDSTEDAWYQAICIELQKVAARHDRRLWVVVDDLGSTPDGAPLMDRRIRAFFEQFALFLLSPVFAQRFRLMLIHYPEDRVPTKWKAELWDEEVASEAAIQDEQVREYLADWARARNVTLHESDLAALTADVMDAAAAPDPRGLCRLARLHHAVSHAVAELERKRP
jgi:hypothetical protein